MVGRTAFLTVIAFLFLPLICQAREAGWDTVGIRAGFDLTDGHRSNDNFETYQGFVNYLLPFKYGNAPGFELRTRLDTSAGALKRKDETGFIAATGPSLAFGVLSDALEVDTGMAVAYISKHKFPWRNLGGPIQFVVHAGLGIYLWDIGIAYRYEHISNADIDDSNPGLNLHTMELKYRF